MKANYNLDMEDFMSFQKYYLSTSKSSFKGKIISGIILIIILGFVWGSSPVIRENNILSYIFIGLVVFSASIGYLNHDRILHKTLLRNFKKNFKKEDEKIFFGDFLIILNEDNFIISHNGNEGKTLWSSLVKIEENKDYIYLYQTINCAIILPKNKFSNIEGGTLEALLEFIRVHTKKVAE